LAAGLYQITNTVNENFYVGSSIDVHHRWHCHKLLLNKGTHHNNHLQNAWARYGAAAFEFKILLVCDPEDRFDYETCLLERVIGQPDCYNILPGGNSGWRSCRAPDGSFILGREPSAGKSHTRETVMAILDVYP
jgi:group I intron endonuclease